MRAKTIWVAGKKFPLLNEREGRLVVWCPDERADFMSPEKSARLAALAAEKPALTSLKTYVNRQGRDPGALKDALRAGGYFFPTNPQSRKELKNLLSLALSELEGETGRPLRKLLLDARVGRALESLGVRVQGGRLLVQSPLEGGMLGMAVPYLRMIEEARRRGDARAAAVWNPASIGAALAALVLCDRAVRPSPRTRIHGVFDIANLQSLAQLFGVAVERHQSGRQTAYVGLGSSSYATGNLCFDVLKRSAQEKGAFRGRSHLHPATHTLNPVARALVFAEEIISGSPAPRKPEPAGPPPWPATCWPGWTGELYPSSNWPRPCAPGALPGPRFWNFPASGRTGTPGSASSGFRGKKAPPCRPWPKVCWRPWRGPPDA